MNIHQPLLGIVILNWNGLHETIECLNSLENLAWQPTTITYVIDNHSVDQNLDIIKSLFPRIFLIKNSKNLGYAGGNNLGIELALKDGCDFILLLNNDTTVAPNLLKEMLRIAQSGNRIGVVVPKIVFHKNPSRIQYAGGTIDLYRARSIRFGFNKRDNPSYNHVASVSFATGTALLVSAEVLRQIAWFDESFFLYHEDSDFSIRVKKASYKIMYTGHTFVTHKESVSHGGYLNPTSFFYSVRNGFFLVMRHGTVFHKIIFLIYFFSFFPIGVLAYSITYRKLRILTAFVKAVKAAVRNKRGAMN